MTFSAGLSDPLLLIHGMQDDVVPFKTTMVLMERLMEQGNHCFGARTGVSLVFASFLSVQRRLALHSKTRSGGMPGTHWLWCGVSRRAGDCRGGHAQLGSAAPRR